MRYRCFVLALSLFVVLGGLYGLPADAAEWSRFRGANGAGVSTSKGLPAEFGPGKNEIWSATVPFGRSSPIVAGDRIYLTAIEDGALVTLALEAKTGKTLWKQSVRPARSDEHHHDTDSATTTPVTDGKNVYAFFQEFGIVAYDKNGKQRWTYAMGPFRNFYGIAASPITSGGLLYMLCDQAEGSYLVALDTETGKEAWRAKRPGRLESYTTPVLYPDEKKPTALLIYGSAWVDAYEPKTGKALWTASGVGVGPVSSPVVAGDRVYVVAPNHGEQGWAPFEAMTKEHDKDGDGKLTREEVAESWLIEHFGWLDRDADGAISEADWTEVGKVMTTEHFGAYAIQLGGAKPETIWNYRSNASEIASPLVHAGVFYMVDKGILTTLNADTGELIKRDRIAEGSPKVYASPIVAEDRVYLGTLDGKLVVVSAKGQWEQLASIDFGDEIWATPAIDAGRLYVRTRGKLYGFGK